MFHVIIPARFSASRLPGKPLLAVGDRPLIQWVWQSARASGPQSVTIATDDARIAAAARGFGAECLMTSPRHHSGTDRVAEAARTKGLAADDIVVNLQGDEPLMPPAVVGEVAAALRARPDIDIASAAAPIRSLAEFLDPACVKALPALDGTALYFSRAPVPWPRDHVAGGRPAGFAGAWRHIGIYAYRVRSLLKFSAWPPTPLEEAEKLEQLRALEHGMRIHLVALSEPPPAGVDTPEDLERVRALLAGGRIVDVGHGAVLMPTARPSKEMSVLFVCLGNICRSPTAEGVLRHLLGQLAPELRVEVDSAGTAGYHIGEPPDVRTRRAALRRGIDLSALRARQVVRGDFARFDFILAMDRSNLRELQALRPAGSRAAVRLFMEYAPELERPEVPDPYYGDADGFEEVLDLSAAASRGLIAALQKMA